MAYTVGSDTPGIRSATAPWICSAVAWPGREATVAAIIRRCGVARCPRSRRARCRSAATSVLMRASISQTEGSPNSLVILNELLLWPPEPERRGERVMATRTSRVGAGILSEAQTAKREEILGLLRRAYWMEMETVMNYLANAEHLDGCARRRSPRRCRRTSPRSSGTPAPSRAASRTSTAPRRVGRVHAGPAVPPAPGRPDRREDRHRGRDRGREGRHRALPAVIEACDGVDWATQDMVIEILRDEENHLRTFERYLSEYPLGRSAAHQPPVEAGGRVDVEHAHGRGGPVRERVRDAGRDQHEGPGRRPHLVVAEQERQLALEDVEGVVLRLRGRGPRAPRGPAPW